MKSSKTLLILVILLILLFSVTSTVFAQAVDSSRFSINETKILLDRYVNYNKLQKYANESDSMAKEYESIIKIDSIQISACEKVSETQNKLIGASDELKEELRKQNKKTERKLFAASLGMATEFIVIVYQIIINGIR